MISTIDSVLTVDRFQIAAFRPLSLTSEARTERPVVRTLRDSNLHS